MLVASAAAIVFWHLPSPWDAAVLNPVVHATEHFTFLSIGLAIGSYLQALSDSAKITALLAAFFGHMGYAVILVAPWNIQVYPLYSIADQAILGWALILTGWAFLVGVAYIVRKNPAWLQGFSGSAVKQTSKVQSPAAERWRGRIAAAASLSLILVLVVYFFVTGAAVAFSTTPSPSGSCRLHSRDPDFLAVFAAKRGGGHWREQHGHLGESFDILRHNQQRHRSIRLGTDSARRDVQPHLLHARGLPVPLRLSSLDGG